LHWNACLRTCKSFPFGDTSSGVCTEGLIALIAPALKLIPVKHSKRAGTTLQLAQSDSELQPITPERNQDTQLPLETTRVWGGRGSGRPCALCERVIGPAEIEYELEVPVDGAVQTLRFHLDCHALWQLEYTRD
jgi:hypothetical protein